MIMDSFAHVGIGVLIKADVGFGQSTPVKGLFQDAMVNRVDSVLSARLITS
jgi:hypothetical protein